METNVRQIQALAETFIRERLVPTRQPFLAVFHVFAAQDFVERVSQRHFGGTSLPSSTTDIVKEPSAAMWSVYCSCSLKRPFKPAAKKSAEFELISPPNKSSE